MSKTGGKGNGIGHEVKIIDQKLQVGYKSLVQSLHEACQGYSGLFGLQRPGSKGNAGLHLFGLFLFSD